MGRAKRGGERDDWSIDSEGGSRASEDTWRERERRRMDAARDEVREKLRPWMKVVR